MNDKKPDKASESGKHREKDRFEKLMIDENGKPHPYRRSDETIPDHRQSGNAPSDPVNEDRKE